MMTASYASKRDAAWGAQKAAMASSPRGVRANAEADMEAEEKPQPILLPKQIEGMRKKQPADVISEAGSDEEEELDVEGAPSEQHDQDIAANGGGGDARIYYDKLKADTPLQRMRKREAKARREDDPWGRVRLRQEVLGLAKLYGRGGAYESEEGAHMHVPAAHFALAKAYAEANCMQQAADHCHAAMETMDFKKTPQDKAVAWSREVYTMLAESQLTVVPPDPRAALRYVCTAAGVSVKRLEDIQDQSLRVLAAQCLTLIGMVKYDEASASAQASVALQQRSELLQVRLGELPLRCGAAERLKARLSDAARELAEEKAFREKAAEAARVKLDMASDILIGVISEEEDRMRAAQVPDYQKHPLIQALWRQSCELMFKMALVEGMLGNTKQQLTRLGEIVSAEVSYGCVPRSLHARVLKEQGAALVSIGLGDPEARDGKLNDALKVYHELLVLQESRFPGESQHKQRALARAEALKLQGNVHIALRQWAEAEGCYQEALDIFLEYNGPDDMLAADLQHRMREVESYLHNGGNEPKIVAEDVAAPTPRQQGGTAGSAIAASAAATVAVLGGASPHQAANGWTAGINGGSETGREQGRRSRRGSASGSARDASRPGSSGWAAGGLEEAQPKAEPASPSGSLRGSASGRDAAPSRPVSSGWAAGGPEEAQAGSRSPSSPHRGSWSYDIDKPSQEVEQQPPNIASTHNADPDNSIGLPSGRAGNLISASQGEVSATSAGAADEVSGDHEVAAADKANTTEGGRPETAESGTLRSAGNDTLEGVDILHVGDNDEEDSIDEDIALEGASIDDGGSDF
mmetsp:Transcript_25613/g.75733  ORF Transcript_25613/g.75733 Transcript_25613/m.75733 type:complete len:810 (-) Transcript_25613:801-3230(-)